MSEYLGSYAIVAELEGRIHTLMEQFTSPVGVVPSDFGTEQLEALEQRWHARSRELADLTVALQVQRVLASSAHRQAVKQLIQQQPKRLRDCGYRPVKVRFSGGTVITLNTVYYARRCDEPGRAKRGKGLYPGLLLLGIHDRCTPGLASEIAVASAALCSFEEARHMLASHGCALNIKTIRTVVKRLAARARLAQQTDEQLGRQDHIAIEGRRVVVSTDGGRLRIRKKKRGPKTRKGYNRYTADWREPKLLIIYIVNDEGRQEKSFCPYLDGTLGGPDAVFGLIAWYLERLAITQADRLLFVADGARWIWDRARPMLETLGLKGQQVFELIDFYHAVEHLTALAKLKARWTTTEREAWVRKQRRRLRQGKTDAVIEAVRVASKGAKNTLLRREREYFVKNRSRLNYGRVAAMKLPIGSGAIESSIRRVVNLRLKGASIYWNDDTAQEMLMLRCYYKAGRWDDLKRLACAVAA